MRQLSFCIRIRKFEIKIMTVIIVAIIDRLFMRFMAKCTWRAFKVRQMWIRYLIVALCRSNIIRFVTGNTFFQRRDLKSEGGSMTGAAGNAFLSMFIIHIAGIGP